MESVESVCGALSGGLGIGAWGTGLATGHWPLGTGRLSVKESCELPLVPSASPADESADDP